MADYSLILAGALAFLVVLVASVSLARRRRKTADVAAPAPAAYAVDDEARRRRDALFADERLDAVVARTRDGAGPLREAAEALAAGDAAGAKRRLEHPDAQLDRGAYPEYWWLLAKARLAAGSRERAVAAAREALAIPGLEAREAARAWSVLRELGESPPPAGAERALGAVAEVGKENGAAVFAAYADGEAAVVFSGGGGSDGRLADAEVRGAAAAFVEAAGAVAAHLAPAPEHPWPAAGRVRVTLLTPAGPRAAEAAAREVEQPAHPLHGAYVVLHGLIAATRERTRAVARIAVTRDDRVTLDGRPVTLDVLRADLARLKAADGAVWFHRPNPHQDPSPLAHEVFLAILHERLPVTLSETDFAGGDPPAGPRFAPSA